MDNDLDDAPPLLVAADSSDQAPDLVNADLPLVKVPITIVTGVYYEFVYCFVMLLIMPSTFIPPVFISSTPLLTQ